MDSLAHSRKGSPKTRLLSFYKAHLLLPLTI